ncbi:MAG TPA: ATP synthase F1 subunit gamma [Bryobacteraceae bacterium]|nr:ATP synthase F1 subunit gamma [Bryobacteraceae bacterium]
MPSLIDLRRRIRSVKNTQQITKAMKVVSAAKLRRAQDRVLAARPYAESIQRMLVNVAQAADENQEGGSDLLVRREEKRIQLLVITADRGLAGAFNSNVIRAAAKFMKEKSGAEIHLELIGRKARDFFRKRHKQVSGEYTTIFQKVVRYEDALEISQKVIERFKKAEIDAVYLVVNNFKSMLASKLVTQQILPVQLPEQREQIDYIYEQPPGQLLEHLLPRYIEAQIYRALLESAAAEHAARMAAMEAASSNAADVIDSLTLKMNRVRQASITREIIEIVSGAAALG